MATILPDYRLAALAPPYLMDFTGAVGMPGGMLSLAVDSSQQGSGVLFASVQRCRQSKDERSRPECMYSLCDNPENCKEQRYGSLRAFDPFTMKELWNNQMDPFASDEDKNYWFAKFVPPTIGHGRVFLATASNRVLVYGRQPVIRPLNRPPQLEPRQILARMTASNLGNSVGDATLLDWMTGDNRYYRRLAHACLEVLGSKRLVATATDLDKVNFFYLQYFGMDDEVGIASDHSFSKRALQRALLLAHNDKNGGTAKLLAEVMR